LHLFYLSGNMMKNVRTLLKERDPLLFAYLVSVSFRLILIITFFFHDDYLYINGVESITNL